MLVRVIHPESRHDVAVLSQMLVEAVNWRPDRRRLALEEVLADPTWPALSAAGAAGVTAA